jgi:hypothetical protein
MKPTKYLAALAALTLTTPVFAGGTFNLTGSTAFRSAVCNTLKAKFAAGGNYQYGHDQAAGSLTSCTYAIFTGTFPGITGTTTIRCCFTGSVEGVRSLVLGSSDTYASYYPSTAVLTTPAASSGGETAAIATGGIVHASANIAFSDVSKAATPYGASALDKGDPMGVIVFTMLTNNGSPITNVTSQQYRALLTQGYQPQSMFTFDPSDTYYVFAEGRNDSSGTRTTALAETGFGITTPVNQYVTTAHSGTAISTIQLTPAGSGFASTVWGQDQAGNGGYTTGGAVRGDFQWTGASVNVLDEHGNTVLSGAQVNLVTWLGATDAGKVIGAGNAKLCAYNGVSLDLSNVQNGNFSSNDIAKIQNGSYTAWGYERLYVASGQYTGDVQSITDGLLLSVNSQLAPNVASNQGIDLKTMAVSRQTDGGLVAP